MRRDFSCNQAGSHPAYPNSISIPSEAERRDPVKGTSICVASGATITQEIDPQRIDPVAPTILHEKRGFHCRQVADQGLRGIADHQKRNIVLIDEIAVV